MPEKSNSQQIIGNSKPGFSRPQRLSTATRDLASRALAAVFGKALANCAAVDMDDMPGFDALTQAEQYLACVRRIAERAPMRLVTNRLAGSATLDLARAHFLPARYKEQTVFDSTSHLTPGFDYVTELGWNGLRKEIETKHATAAGDDAAYCQALLHTLDSVCLFHARTLAFVHAEADAAAGAEKASLASTADALARVPLLPPRSFREALQSIWFQFSFQRLLGNWPAIGRLDQMLWPYYAQDLESGALTKDEAREWLAHFFIAGCEWITGDFIWNTGDAQHYQNIVLGGSDEDGNDLCNDVTLLVLEVVEELDISDFPIAVRVTQKTPHAVLRKIAEVTALGGGVVAIYNDAVCVEALVKAGIPPKAAHGFANDGCWEIQVPGETHFIYHPIDLLKILNRAVLRVKPEDGELPSFASAAAIIDAFEAALHTEIDEVVPNLMYPYTCNRPSFAIDLYTKGCLERARGYYHGGPMYNNLSLHAGGMADTSNTLYAIDELCFKRQIITLPALLAILRTDWVGQEPLRQYAQKKLVYFGNDNDDADAFFTRVYDIFVRAVNRRTRFGRVRVSPGISTFGREIEWRHSRGATAFGARNGDILATNTSPTPGTDFAGATALLRSHCKVDYTRLSGSAAAQLRLTPSMLAGGDGLEAYVALMRGFLREGGFFLQTDVADKEVYQRARENPDAYRNLSVRISGWSARFVTLNPEWQDMIIQRHWQ